MLSAIDCSSPNCGQTTATKHDPQSSSSVSQKDFVSFRHMCHSKMATSSNDILCTTEMYYLISWFSILEEGTVAPFITTIKCKYWKQSLFWHQMIWAFWVILKHTPHSCASFAFLRPVCGTDMSVNNQRCSMRHASPLAITDHMQDFFFPLASQCLNTSCGSSCSPLILPVQY